MENNLVKPEHQYKHIKDPPLDPVRMAWPFKTEEEREVIRKWFKKAVKNEKQRQFDNHVAHYGKAFL